MGPPPRRPRRANTDGELEFVERLLLYDFLEERDGRIVLPVDFIQLLDLISDADDTDSDF